MDALRGHPVIYAHRRRSFYDFGFPLGMAGGLVVFLAGGALAEWVFRRLATPATIREDLEDRVRDPSD
jgi:hypothetical protein